MFKYNLTENLGSISFDINSEIKIRMNSLEKKFLFKLNLIET